MKKTTAFVIWIFAMITIAMAQSPTPNIALNAVCTHSSGGSGTYGPANYNDGIISVQGSLPWGWTSGATHTNASAWIQFEWTTPQTFGEIKLFYGGINNRYLAGAEIQYWTGSTWAVAHTFLYPAPYDVWERIISFPTVTSTRMRITNWTLAPVGQTSNPNFREIEVRNICTDPATAVDFDAPAFVTLPSSIPVNFIMTRAIGSFNATMTFNFYTPTGILAHSEQMSMPFTAPTVMGQHVVQSTSLTPGFYKLEVIFNVFDICNKLADVKITKVIMVLAPGQTLCEVWPGDTDNNGIVNYNDRASLNRYIYDANMSYIWLNGPARYRTDSETNPFTYYTWELQPSVPWQTPMGCYMDADGNGTINNFDYIAIKLNWMKSKSSIAPKTNNGLWEQSGNNFTFNFQTESKIYVNLYDITGKLVSKIEEGKIVIGTYRIDIPDMKTGIYFLSINVQENEFQYQNIVKIFIQ